MTARHLCFAAIRRTAFGSGVLALHMAIGERTRPGSKFIREGQGSARRSRSSVGKVGVVRGPFVHAAPRSARVTCHVVPAVIRPPDTRSRSTVATASGPNHAGSRISDDMVDRPAVAIRASDFASRKDAPYRHEQEKPLLSCPA